LFTRREPVRYIFKAYHFNSGVSFKNSRVIKQWICWNKTGDSKITISIEILLFPKGIQYLLSL
jgi:hypothetical protein